MDELKKLVETKELFESDCYIEIIRKLESLGLKYIPGINVSIYKKDNEYYVVQEIPRNEKGIFGRRILTKFKKT